MEPLVTHAFRQAYPALFDQIATFYPKSHYQNPQYLCPPLKYPPGKTLGSEQPEPPIWLASSVPYCKYSLLRIPCYLFTPPSQNYCTFLPNSTIMSFSIPVIQVFNFSLTGPTFFLLHATRDDSSSYRCIGVGLNTRLFFNIYPPTY